MKNNSMNRMVDEIQKSSLESIGRKISQTTIDAIKKIDRAIFIPESYRNLAYENQPVAIGYNQTISQPFIVALMTNLLQLKKSDKVLEIGSGCGYQASVLSKLAKKIYTVEVIASLAKNAQNNFKKLKLNNIVSIIGDGKTGLEKYAPFDKIIITAASDKLPQKLLQQLRVGGLMIMPKGKIGDVQKLIVIKKLKDNSFEINHIIDVRFVPLV